MKKATNRYSFKKKKSLDRLLVNKSFSSPKKLSNTLSLFLYDTKRNLIHYQRKAHNTVTKKAKRRTNLMFTKHKN